MPQIIFLPHAVLCPEGLVVDAAPGTSVLEVAHEHHIDIHTVKQIAGITNNTELKYQTYMLGADWAISGPWRVARPLSPSQASWWMVLVRRSPPCRRCRAATA